MLFQGGSQLMSLPYSEIESIYLSKEHFPIDLREQKFLGNEPMYQFIPGVLCIRQREHPICVKNTSLIHLFDQAT